MKITVNRKKFLDALTIGASMAGKTKTVPILDCVKCRVKNNEIILVSSDMECWVMKRTTVDFADIEGEFCLNPNDITKALKTLTDESVEIHIENAITAVIHSKGVIEFPSYDYKSFPTSIKGDNAQTLTVNPELLFNWVNKARSFVANDDLRPVMNGMYLEIKDGKISVCATDAHKLYTDFADFDGDSSINVSAILSSRAFATLMSIINGTETVAMTIDSRNITFATLDAKISCRIIEGNYPNFKMILPKESKIKVSTSTKDLLGAINRVSLFTNSITSLVKLGTKENTLIVSGQDIDFNKRADDECSITIEGGDIEIGVKGDYMTTCLSIVSNENVCLEMNYSTKPIVLKDANNPNTTILIMPMLLG